MPPKEALPEGDRPPRPEPPAVYVDDRALIREARFIRKVLVRCRVRRRDLPDMVQEVLFAAWRGIQAGHFRPSPEIPLQDGLRVWLHGIAWRQASNYRSVAHRRYEALVDQFPELSTVATATEDQFASKQLLAVFRRLPRKDREILLLVALGVELREAARELEISMEAAHARIYRGRQLFLRAIARWRR
jgi:RNA polymerase sigma-70 factor (ECF subfamily)